MTQSSKQPPGFFVPSDQERQTKKEQRAYVVSDVRFVVYSELSQLAQTEAFFHVLVLSSEIVAAQARVPGTRSQVHEACWHTFTSSQTFKEI
jgi:hypothetical protein